MTADELKDKVKENIEAENSDLIILDVIQMVKNYCNLNDVPVELEPFVRKKSKMIINYESENGTTSVFDVKSIKEGDTSITYNVDDKTSKETIYGLSANDKNELKSFRRVRR